MNGKQLHVLSLILCFLVTAALLGCRDGTPEISVTDAKFVPSQMLIGRASSFMKIVNSGTGGDLLKGCAIREHPSVRGEIHDFVNGKMVKIGKIAVPPQHNIDLKMGDVHLMFFGLPEKITDNVTLVLSFEKSGPVEVTVPVAMMAGHGMNH